MNKTKENNKEKDFYTFFQERRRRNLTAEQCKQLSQDAFNEGNMRQASYYKTKYYKIIAKEQMEKQEQHE